MKTPTPSKQLDLPLDGSSQQGDSMPNTPLDFQSEVEHSNVIHFKEALQVFQETQKTEALRRILSRSDEIREG